MMFGVRAQKTPVRTGTESLVGRVGLVRSDLAPVGMVQLGGERWTAMPAPGEDRIPRGERVEVVEVRGLRLLVRRVPSNPPSENGAA
jgi:membrane-bound ClpP family serine protease